MRSFVWVLPLILLVSVVIAAYLLGLAQDKASRASLNSTTYVDREKSSENRNIEKPDGIMNSITNSSQSIIK
jgi:hypothetical protein